MLRRIIPSLTALLIASAAVAPAAAQDGKGASAVKADGVDGATVTARLKRLAEAETPKARQEAMEALVTLGGAAVPYLLQVLKDERPGWEVKTSVAFALGEIGEASGREGLRAVWEGSKEAPGTFRVQVASALAAVGDLEPLRGMVADGAVEKVVLAKAAMALANFQDKASVPTLKKHLADEDIGVFIAIALGRLGDDSGHEALKAAVKEAMFRDHAAVALALSGDTTVIYQVRFALANPDAFVRRDAVIALGRMRDKESLGRIEGLLKSDPDWRVREAAEIAVRRIDPRARRR